MSRMQKNIYQLDTPMFEKKDGTSGISGQLYEQKLVMHFLLSGLMAKENGKIDHFFLGTNVQTAGAFDDIVFKYTKGNKSNIVLLQAKHKDKDTTITMAKLLSGKTKRGDFNLEHYFKSYQESKKILIETDDQVLRDDFHNYEFILLTNATSESKEYSFKYELDLDEFWKMNHSKKIKFNADEKFIDIFGSSELQLKAFLQQFSILFDQPNELQLQELIKKKTSEYLGILQEDLKFVYELALARIQNYWKNESYYLTENTDFFTESQNLWEMKKYIAFNSYLDITYKCVKLLSEEIQKQTSLHIASDEKTKLLHDRRITQALNEMKLQYIFLSLSQIEKMNQTVFNAFENEYDVLVISECEEIDLMKFDIRIKELICSKKKIILICKSIKTTIQFKIINDSNIKFSDLNEESQNKLLNKQILFQGQSVALGAVMLPQLCHYIDEKILTLIAGKDYKLEIGKKMQDLGKLKSCHISRILNRDGIFYEPKDLLQSRHDKSNKFILITGEPGMGKTTLLSSLSEELNCNSSILKWHYRINLVEHSTPFARMKKVNGLDFLCKACKMDEFEKKIFTEYILREGHVILFFDGFDEISPKYKEIVIELLLDLIDTKVEKVWVTTRGCLQEELEKQFKTNSYKLEPFTKEDQKRYLELCGGRSDQKIEKILRIFSESVEDQLGQFAGIPLQLQMLAEIYSESNEDQEINIFRMYDRFVRKKYFEIQFEEKSGADINNLYLHQLIENNYVDTIAKYEKLAIFAMYEDNLCYLFNETEIEEIKKALINDIDGGKEQTGLVVSIVDGKPIFIHRTFAEFFAATCLVRALENNKKIDEFLFAIGYFDNSQIVMRKFFDFALGDDEEIIIATLNNDFKKVNEYNVDDEKRDKGGRTSLHLAAAYGFKDIVCLLKDRYPEISPVDKIFEWTPMSYADNMKEIPVIEILLMAGAEPKDMFRIIKSIESYPDGDLRLIHQILSSGSCMCLFISLVKINRDFVNFEDILHFNKTALHYAAFCGNLDVIKFMMKVKGCQLKYDKEGSTIMHECASVGHLHVMEYLTNDWSKFQINSVDKWGRTPLFVAAENGHYEIVRLLIERGSTMNDDNWQRILRITEELGLSSIVQLLESNKKIIIKQTVPPLEIGVMIEDPDLIKLNEMSQAIEENNYDEVKRIFVEDINLVDRIFCQSDSYKVKEVQNFILIITATKDIEIFKFLVSQSKKLLHYTNNAGATLLHHACIRGNLPIIRFLISKGIDLKTKDLTGKTCLSYAVLYGHFEVLNRFVSSNDDIINDFDIYGHTLLHSAAIYGHKDIAVQLIERGVDPKKKDDGGFSFLHFAAQSNQKEFIEQFVSSNKELMHTEDYNHNTLLHIAVANGAIETVAFLCELDADPLKLNKIGDTPWHLSAAENRLEVTKYFLEKNIGLINAKTPDGSTILHIAARMGRLEMIIYLLEKGADYTLKNNRGFTCLHLATAENHLGVINIFLKTNRDLVHSCNIDGYTALHLEAQFNRVEAAELLLQHEASFLIIDNRGSTCLYYAVIEGHLEFVKKFMPLFKTMTCKDPKQLYSLLKGAAIYDRLEIFTYLIEEDADPWMKDGEESILFIAIQLGHLRIVQHLVTIDKSCIDDNDETTPLCLAAGLNRIEILEFLLEQGADPTIIDVDGDTCYDCATPEGKLLISKYLPST